MKTCPDCGCNVYSRGCVNCDEPAYIAQQEALTAEQYPEAPSLAPRAGGEEPQCAGPFVDARDCPKCSRDIAAQEERNRAAQNRAAVRAWLDRRIAAWSGTRDAARLLQREAVYEETLFRHCRAANEADLAINVLRAERDALMEGE